jgi:biopolymer transport protein ExbB
MKPAVKKITTGLLIGTYALVFSVVALTAPVQAADSPAQSLDALLELVQQGRARDAREQQQRLSEFRSQVAEQDRLVREKRSDIARLEQRSAQLEDEFRQREQVIAQREQALNERLGSLREMFGVLQQVAGDVRGIVDSSVTSSQFPERDVFLGELIDKAGSSSSLPSIEEIERLWFEMQREATQSGKVLRYDAPVVNIDGQREQREVIRIGAFNVLSDGRYLNYDAERDALVELARQPAGRYLSTAEAYGDATVGNALQPVWIDPSRGSLLSLLIQTPDLRERINQGGTVGYIIIALGLFALLLAMERMITLGMISKRMNKQMRQDAAADDNPLGRVMIAYDKHQNTDKETLELRLGEAIIQEQPRLTRFLPILKIVSVVAPLLGLLGTVTGMINTFQAITLFGTGDPKLMAGGISQALVTTVLGLAVAIPAVLLHTVVNGRSKRLVQVLEERAVGIIAGHEELTGEETAGAGNA